MYKFKIIIFSYLLSLIIISVFAGVFAYLFSHGYIINLNDVLGFMLLFGIAYISLVICFWILNFIFIKKFSKKYLLNDSDTRKVKKINIIFCIIFWILFLSPAVIKYLS